MFNKLVKMKFFSISKERTISSIIQRTLDFVFNFILFEIFLGQKEYHL